MAKKVLVVDDSRAIRSQVRVPLAEAGFAVMEAEDGQDALDKVRANTDIALIICDVNMPRMNGLEMLETLKGDQNNSRLPVIMLTTEVHQSLIDRAKKAGARGWLVKPFKPELLIATVKKVTGVA